MTSEQVRILQGSTFAVSDRSGDMDDGQGSMEGLFFEDMRHLSRWRIRLNGRRPKTLSIRAPEYHTADFFLAETVAAFDEDATLSVMRHRQITGGMREYLEVTNHGTRDARLDMSLGFDADFADLFQVKSQEAKPPKGEHYRQRQGTTMTLGYRRGDFCRETHIRNEDGAFGEDSLTFRLSLSPGQRWSTRIDIAVGTEPGRPRPQRDQPHMPRTLREWLADAPRLDTDWSDLRRIYHHSLADLAALRFYPPTVPDASLPAGGVPWYMALFGRDSLIASYQALPFAPELARTTLRALAARQAADFDDFRDAEPGKILHELRHGELTHFDERPQSPYYGTADATPLFLIVLDEYERWSGDGETVRDLEQAARAALRWIEEYADLVGDGFVWYQQRNQRTGMANHCWKDSWNSIVHPDGTLAAQPRAVCEIQGYAYDARRRAARLARDFWHDPALAQRLDRDAETLRRRFNDTFWDPDQQYYVLALDGRRQPVRTIASNMGQLLWSGMVPEDRLDAVVGHLCGDRMFSGWGVRTLAEGQLAYNPLGYHTGTVWPHDTALIAAGLARYGRRAEANRLVVAIVDAASQVGYRLPEAFVGYPRATTGTSVVYPNACSPQAWSAGAPLLCLRVLLGLEPDGERLSAAPELPEPTGNLALVGIPGRWGRCDAGRTS